MRIMFFYIVHPDTVVSMCVAFIRDLCLHADAGISTFTRTPFQQDYKPYSNIFQIVFTIEC